MNHFNLIRNHNLINFKLFRMWSDFDRPFDSILPLNLPVIEINLAVIDRRALRFSGFGIFMKL